MAQNAMADVIGLLDVTALVGAVMSMPEVQTIAGDFDEV